jgi:hypothetical protein
MHIHHSWLNANVLLQMNVWLHGIKMASMANIQLHTLGIVYVIY